MWTVGFKILIAIIFLLFGTTTTHGVTYTLDQGWIRSTILQSCMILKLMLSRSCGHEKARGREDYMSICRNFDVAGLQNRGRDKKDTGWIYQTRLALFKPQGRVGTGQEASEGTNWRCGVTVQLAQAWKRTLNREDDDDDDDESVCK